MATNARSLMTLGLAMTFTVLIYAGIRVSRRTVVMQLEKVNIPDAKPRQAEQKVQEGGVYSETVVEHERKVVILLSNQRSGSSFVGDFFAHSNDAFYLFEPLHPYGMSCDKLSNERLEFLQKISLCKFSTLVEDYKTAYSMVRVKSHRECLRYHLCSVSKHRALLKRYVKLCFATLNQTNPTVIQQSARSCARDPIKLDIWSSLCRSSRIVAFKILRVCSLEELESVSENLSEMGYKVHVIELVRDPRGIVNSALKLELKLDALEERLDIVCGRFRRNADYVEKRSKATDSTRIRRYMRIRFEDIAEDPIRAAVKIYKFIGESVPEEVISWLEMATRGSKQILADLKQKLSNSSADKEEQLRLQKQINIVTTQGNNPYGTTRNSSNIPLKWRKTLPMNVVEKIQDECGEVMTRLGYKLVRNTEEKENYGIKLY